ncbi:MAG: O-methyltransferase [Acidobacteriota bacterium]
MKDRFDTILRPAQARYLESLLPQRDALLGEMEALAATGDIPISDPEVGQLLTLLARATGARLVVEVGTAIGYGTLCLARGASSARVVSIDTSRERIETARGYLTRAGVMGRVELLEGAALEILPTLDEPIDLAYVDAVKTEYRQYIDLLVPRLRPGGMVVLDNLLWQGQVAEPAEDEDESTVALREVNQYLVRHPQLDALVLPLGDGLGVATRVS